ANVLVESLDNPLEVVSPGKCQVVGVACVDCTCRTRQARQSTIEAKSAQVRQRRRGRRTLRQVRAEVKRFRFPASLSSPAAWRAVPGIARNGVRAETGQAEGNGLRVPERPEQGHKLRVSNRRKEVGQIELQHDPL